MIDLGFTPEGNRILASITDEDENGDISALIRAVGAESNMDVSDIVHVTNGNYKRMTISGVDCILFKEDELYSE